VVEFQASRSPRKETHTRQVDQGGSTTTMELHDNQKPRIMSNRG